MTNEFRKKAVELGKLMNNKSKLSVPLVKCIIECFEIVFSEQDIDYMTDITAGMSLKNCGSLTVRHLRKYLQA